ncbi:MAG: glucose-methanol-choline oxidoreductase [Frankiales bacterium]|nr:glucose-methanol-choline oxidoreductase [Frankiales bacterium]
MSEHRSDERANGIDDAQHDVVVVGAGIAGSLVAKRLTQAGFSVLVLEAGPATAAAFDDYSNHVQAFYAATSKGPESAWPPAAGVPQPDTADIRTGDGYFVQAGPLPYGSTYTRLQGGSTLHWLGVSLRMLPEDFQLQSSYGVGRDWPLDYWALEPFYGEAEHEIGVAADVVDQTHLGLEFAPGYDYPMHRIPPSYSDRLLAAAVDGMTVNLGEDQLALKVRNYPAARNSMPRGDYRPVGAVDQRRAGQGDGHGLARDLGQRCAGNTACTPICPIQAKYNAGKTLAQADGRTLQVVAQAVASKIQLDPVTGEVRGIEYQRYDDPASARHTVHVARGRVYVLAAHAIENAKLMLASGLGSASGMLGRNLMDHPSIYGWGLASHPVGPYRGPLSTSGIDDLRGGPFRARHAALRVDVGNDGWRAPTGAPDSTVTDAVANRGLFGTALREHLRSTLSRHVRFSLNVEQLPSRSNRVSIDPRYVDLLGNPRPVINYDIDEYTLAGMAAAKRVYQEVFRRAGIKDCTDPEQGVWFPSVAYQGDTLHYHGMGHFAGTHVMGNDPAQSVVDTDQRCWEHRNLFLVGSGSFPTMGTSNPTLTLAALALRTARHLAKELST